MLDFFFLVTRENEKNKRRKKGSYIFIKDTPRASTSKACDKLDEGFWNTIRGSILIAHSFASTYAQASA